MTIKLLFLHCFIEIPTKAQITDKAINGFLNFVTAATVIASPIIISKMVHISSDKPNPDQFKLTSHTVMFAIVAMHIQPK